MGMKQTLEVINAMEADGIIGRHAIGDAVAAYNYIEPTVTDDLDILVSFRETADRPKFGLITLSPLFAYLKAKGYQEHRKEGLVIEGWPVQFLPVACGGACSGTRGGNPNQRGRGGGIDAHLAGRAPCRHLLASRQTEGPHQNYAISGERCS